MSKTIQSAKKSLDALIRKSRVHIFATQNIIHNLNNIMDVYI